MFANAVEYSLRKHRRWEWVEELIKSDDVVVHVDARRKVSPLHEKRLKVWFWACFVGCELFLWNVFSMHKFLAIVDSTAASYSQHINTSQNNFHQIQ
jgi:hypothetical protein